MSGKPGTTDVAAGAEDLLRIRGLVAAWAPRLETRDAREARQRLDDARGAIITAIEWAIVHDVAAAADILVDGATYWVGRGLTAPATQWAATLLEDLPDATPGRARVLATLVRLGGVRRDNATWEIPVAEALDLGLSLGLRDVAIEALYEIADPDGVAGVPLSTTVDALARVRALGPESVRERAIALDLEATVARRSAGPGAEAAILARGLADARREGMLRRMVHLGANLADLQLSLGRTQESGATAAEAALDAREIGDSREEARALGVLAVVHQLEGDEARAGRALRRAVLLAAAADMPISTGHALRCAALCGAIAGRGGDVACLLAAADGLELFGSDADRLGHTVLARHVARARRAAGADAWAVAQAEGATMTASQALARAEIVADSIKATTAGVRGVPLGLSQREIGVLTLLGEGLTDADIGARLFISPKTVSVHLTNARAKTGARSRIELAVLARALLGAAQET